MKVQERVLDVTSTLEGDVVKMSIDPASFVHLMSVLTDLYSDPEMAVIREYSTNAYDAHIEAGVSRPIEVTLPTSLAPYLTIRDFGAGLDPEDIHKIYCLYGASTKRHSNDMNGMLGLGSKSALTYTDQFTITSTKNGKTMLVAVARDADGAGSMTIVDEYESDNESGVEIQIPAKGHNEFAQKAEQLFRFWKKGTVLVNGQEPKMIDGFWVSDDLLLTTELQKSMIVMGNVAYPMEEGYEHPAGYKTVAFVPIGSVVFTPSRESLQFNALTKETIKSVKERLNTERDKAIETQVANASSHVEALQLAMQSTVMGYKGVPKYQGLEVPGEYSWTKIEKRMKTQADGTDKLEDVETWDYILLVKGEKVARQKDSWSEHTLTASTFAKVIFMENFDGADWSPYKRLKLEQWMAKNNVTRPANFVMLDTVPAELRLWIDPAHVMDWSGPSAEKIVREKTVTLSGRKSGSYKAYVDDVYEPELAADEINMSAPIYYWVAQKDSWGNIDRPNMNIVKTNDPQHTIVQLSPNRVNKFLRDFPMALEITDYNKITTELWKSNLTDDQKIWLTVQSKFYDSAMKYFDASEMLDPEVKKIIEMLTQKNDTLLNEARLYGTPYVELGDPMDEYPLVPDTYYLRKNNLQKSHAVLYMNAVYAAKHGTVTTVEQQDEEDPAAYCVAA